MKDDKLLTMKEVAERLSIGRTTAYKLVEDGDLKAKRIGTGRGTLRVRPVDLERYINQPEQTKTSIATGSLYDDSHDIG
jgi:excisionase family DNA binding protein